MTIRLPDRWVWDSWYVKDGDTYHAFYLCASRGLVDPDRRHRYTSVGHAVSTDLVNWSVLPDALAPSDSPSWDSWTTWTGSVVKGDDGLWWMFYTGSSREDGGDVQRIGAAQSADLMSWTKLPQNPLVEADLSVYEGLHEGNWHDQAWRDPWVYKKGDTWHMLITARKAMGEKFERGTIGHAVSRDLLSWQVTDTYLDAKSNFGQLEVLQLINIDGRDVLIFCCGWRELGDSRPEKLDKLDGVYSLILPEALEDLDLTQAVLFPNTDLYAARAIQGPDGDWFLLGFKNLVDGDFVGEISDPIRIKLGDSGLMPA